MSRTNGPALIYSLYTVCTSKYTPLLSRALSLRPLIVSIVWCCPSGHCV